MGEYNHLNPIKFRSLQPMFPLKRFHNFSPLLGRCLEGLDAFIFFLERVDVAQMWIFTSTSAPLSLSRNIRAFNSIGYDSIVTSAPLPRGRNTTVMSTSYELFPHFPAPGVVSSQFHKRYLEKHVYQATQPSCLHLHLYRPKTIAFSTYNDV